MPFLVLFLKSIHLFVFLFQYFFSYLEKSYAAFLMGQELDELGEYDNEFIENISKCFKKMRLPHFYLITCTDHMYHNFFT